MDISYLNLLLFILSYSCLPAEVRKSSYIFYIQHEPGIHSPNGPARDHTLTVLALLCEAARRVL